MKLLGVLDDKVLLLEDFAPASPIPEVQESKVFLMTPGSESAKNLGDAVKFRCSLQETSITLTRLERDN